MSGINRLRQYAPLESQTSVVKRTLVREENQVVRHQHSGSGFYFGTNVAGKRPNKVYAASKITDNTHSMARTPRPADGDIRRAINILRARSREEYQSNDYAKKAVNIIKQNVIGSTGIRFQATPKRRNGEKDKPASDALEVGFKRWGKRGSPDVTAKLSWKDIQNLFVHSLVVDGEAIVVEPSAWQRNSYGFAVQFVDPFLLDSELNKDLKNGNRIRMGVEIDRWGAPVAYYFLEHDVTQDDYRLNFQREHVRIPAGRVLHIYMPEYVVQTRGVPLLATSLLRFNMLRGYEDAELVAARVAAAKMGFFIDADDGSGFQGDTKDGDQSYIDAAEPGHFPRLPAGTDFKEWDPQHPNTAFEGYLKAVLRGAAAGLNVPYNTMANDLEGVNFSSLRAGNLDAHDGWKCFQELIVESLCDWTYEKWLSASLLRNVLEVRPGVPLNPALHEKYSDVKWVPRRWDHVQPFEQERANQLKIQNRTSSISQIIRDQGREPEDVFEEISEERQRLVDLGIPLELETSSNEEQTETGTEANN